MSDKPQDVRKCCDFAIILNKVQQWYTVAMYELQLDPSTIAAIVKRVEQLRNE